MARRTEDLPQVQRASKRLFGGTYSLEIGAWIWAFGAAPINPTGLTNGLRPFSEPPPSHGSVVAEIRNLETAGLLRRLGVSGRETYYQRGNSVYFELCHRLREEIASRSPAEPPGGSPEQSPDQLSLLP